jgi:L-lactate dehydrogenase complex protein LldG
MSAKELNPMLESIRHNLGREASAPLQPRPPIVPPRQANSTETEFDLLIREINNLSGNAKWVSRDTIGEQLEELIQSQAIKKACLWETAWLAELHLIDRLQSLGVEVVPNQADRMDLAECDLGITEVDFALPETGTLGLLSSPAKPRVVSLLPRVHLAFVHPGALRPDLHEVFAEAKNNNYLILITGPSRTSDIELTVTLGVHGPKFLYVWVCNS